MNHHDQKIIKKIHLIYCVINIKVYLKIITQQQLLLLVVAIIFKDKIIYIQMVIMITLLKMIQKMLQIQIK